MNKLVAKDGAVMIIANRDVLEILLQPPFYFLYFGRQSISRSMASGTSIPYTLP